MDRPHFDALDGFRGLAVLAVLSVHYLGLVVPSVFSWGWTGVDFFFVLSGFLITGILYDSQHSTRRFRNFYARRTLRIFPLYFCLLFACLLVVPIFHWQWHPAWRLWPIYLGNYARFIYLHDFLQNPASTEHLRASGHYHFRVYTGHFWSLCVEEQFYLLWPLAVFSIRDRRRLMNVCAGAIFGCLALRILCVLVVPKAYLGAELLERITFLRADSLLLGGYVALALRGPAPEWVHGAARRVFGALVAGFVVLEALHWVARRSLIRADSTDPWMSTIGFSLIDLLSASVVVLALDQRSWAGRLGAWEPLRQLGVISYGFYVFHDLPHEIYGALAASIAHGSAYATWLEALIALVGTLMLASISYVVLETPFLKLKRYFVAESEGRATSDAEDRAVVLPTTG